MVQTAKNGKKQFNKQDVETAALVPMDVPQENGVVAVRKGDRRRHAMFPILPDQDSVLGLDVYHGTDELVPMPQSDGELNRNTAHNVLKAAVNPLSSSH